MRVIPALEAMKKDHPGDLLPSGLAELVRSRLSERRCFKKMRQTVMEADTQY